MAEEETAEAAMVPTINGGGSSDLNERRGSSGEHNSPLSLLLSFSLSLSLSLSLSHQHESGSLATSERWPAVARQLQGGQQVSTILIINT
jgi:hypothetical protein